MNLIEFSHRTGDSVLGATALARVRKSLASVVFKPRRGCATAIRSAILSCQCVLARYNFANGYELVGHRNAVW